MNQHFNMLYRNLIYTGLTRAKKLCVFVGQRGAFSRSVKNVKQTKRQTSLIELLKLKQYEK
jgi:exodeoxyribonuclease V alpha subunit